MLPPVLEAALIQAGVVVILCVGFTFTYMTEKFPNFAHTAIATIGTIIAFTCVTVLGWSPYMALPVSALACGGIGVLLYLFIVSPLRRTGAHVITLTFAFFAVAEVIGSLVSMYSYWYLQAMRRPTAGFQLSRFDFSFLGYPGVFWASAVADTALFIFLYLFLNRSRHGIALRAVAEDEPLASSLGINTYRIHFISWFMTGSLAGLAGGIIPLWTYTGLGYSDAFLITVMSGCVVGGLNNVAGAVVGGFLVATSQKFLNAVYIALFGVSGGNYEPLYPMIFIVAVLMLEPEGIMGIFENGGAKLRRLRNRLIPKKLTAERDVKARIPDDV